MDQTEDDWGGKIEFGFSDKTFCKDIEDYFLLFEDECSLQSHTCAARVARVLEHTPSDSLNLVSFALGGHFFFAHPRIKF